MDNKYKWFDHARFGIFIHWGLYSIPAKGEWLMRRSNIPRAEYNKLAKDFRVPESFSPEEWVLLAKNAGAKYAVLTARHHDGFSLYDSEINSFNSMNTPSRRDFVREYVSACRKHGLKVGLYFSLVNWQHPASITGPSVDPQGWKAMIDEVFGQVRELLTNYGKIDLLWYDGCMLPGGGDPAKQYRSAELNAMARSLQSSILINDRAYLPEDFSTSEQEVTPPAPGRRWESCMTMNLSWGFNQSDHDFKDATTIAKCLVRCARYGGNLLLNIGPRADGSVPDESTGVLRSVGEWLSQSGESIYGSRRTAFTECDHAAGSFTCVKRKYFLHVFARQNQSLWVDGMKHAHGARLLNTGEKLTLQPVGGGTVRIGGFSGRKAAGDFPEDIALLLKGGVSKPANMLGGAYDIDIKSGDAPVLALGNDANFVLPRGGIILGDALQAADTCQTPVHFEAFQLPVFAWTPYRSTLVLERETSGLYDIELGVVAEREGEVRVRINGKPRGRKMKLSNPLCPDTLTLSKVLLPQGKLAIELDSECGAGIYALRFVPHWSPLPCDRWTFIGPYPTKYGPNSPGSAISEALTVVNPDEQAPLMGKSYATESGLTLKWQRATRQLSRFDASGVDFVYHCEESAKGVCLAHTVVESPRAMNIDLAFYCDNWANIYVNGECIRSVEGAKDAHAEFSTSRAMSAVIPLKAGKNTILVKNHCGLPANFFCLFLNTGAMEKRMH